MKNIWKHISYLGLKSKQKTPHNRTIILSNQISYLLFNVLVILYVLLTVRRIREGGIPSLGSTRVIIVAFISIINLVLAKGGFHELQKISLIFLPTFILIVLPLMVGFVEEESFIYYPYVIIALSLIPALILIPSKNKMLFLLSILYFFLLVVIIDKLLILDKSKEFRIFPIIQEFYFEYKLIPLVIFFFTHLCVYYLRSISQQYSSELEDKNLELKITLDKLKLTQQHLVQYEKMASVGTLTAGIAHEINNPLNFISGGLELITHIGSNIEKNISSEDKKTYRFAVNNIAEGLTRTTNIVSSLMNFSYRGSLKLVLFDVNKIIDNTLLFLKSKMDDEILIEKKYNLTNKVNLYPDKMHQIMQNLIDNALYAVNQTIENGQKIIEISTGITRDNNKEFAEIKIANNGPLIPQEKLSHIFDPFYTTKPPGKGTGLGLSICYSLIQDHSGFIMANNENGFVVFTILIPLNLTKNESI